MPKFIPTAERVEVSDYPYGRLRCTLFNFIEFDPKKGYRHCTQTINPKTNRINNPKKGTYSPFIFRYYNEENNHIVGAHFSFNGAESIAKGIKFCNEVFDLLTFDDKHYLYSLIFDMLMFEKVVYKGYKIMSAEQMEPIFDHVIDNYRQAKLDPDNNYFGLNIDLESIKKVRTENGKL